MKPSRLLECPRDMDQLVPVLCLCELHVSNGDGLVKHGTSNVVAVLVVGKERGRACDGE